ncbi:hypothetical protein [Sphingomonas faeni]|uniref:hypothetical protein n=1 Tax=Sphingomonas faeni TaxID=185950 RepID=UPI0020C80968|nr:hypothetical protein [Sphingomonas faeni]MCP8892529.1 hypothetical protein [Sphingomonas faeni]
MGKVIKTVAVVAIAVAIAVYAPQLTPAFLANIVGTAAATAITATALSFAANAAFQAIAASPADAPSGYRRSTNQIDHSGLRWVEVEPAAPAPEVLEPIEPTWLHSFFFPGQRYSIVRLSGDCMLGVIPDETRWCVVDRLATIRPGDLFAFDLDDLWKAYAPEMRFAWWWRIFATGMVKRYLGTEREWGRLIFDCSNPPSLCETGFNHVRYAYRVRALAPSLLAAIDVRRRVARDPGTFDVMLGEPKTTSTLT